MSSVKKCERPGPATNQPGNEGYAEIITNKMPQRQGDRLPWGAEFKLKQNEQKAGSGRLFAMRAAQYYCDSIHLTMSLMLSSLTDLGVAGMGMVPKVPEPPLRTFFST